MTQEKKMRSQKRKSGETGKEYTKKKNYERIYRKQKKCDNNIDSVETYMSSLPASHKKAR